ncbi:MAG TPA: proline iminopeptidase-family hydrolase [Steroidobacteraceae bacterium]
MHIFRRIPASLLFAAALALGACDSSPPLPDDGFVNAPGGRIAFRVIGEGDGVPVLIIHGGPGSSSCRYAATLAGVAASRPVVMYDQLGSGHSDRMTNLERDAVLSRFVSEVAAIRNELGLEELHLIGHSWGAAVALEYLLTADATGVRSVTFVGPLISTSRWIQDANALVGMLPEETQAAVQAATATGEFDTPEFEAANKVFMGQFLSRQPPDRRNSTDCAASPLAFNSELYEYMWGPSEFVSTGTLRNYDRIGRLPELDIPTLFLVGEYDEARPETMREFQTLVPGSVVKVIPGAAHLVNVDQTAAFNDAIAGFLASVDQAEKTTWSADEAEVRAMLQASVEAFNRADLPGHLSIYDPAVTFMTKNGPRPGIAPIEAAFRKAYFRDGLPKQQLRFEQLALRPLGADQAMATGRFVLSGGEEPDQAGWFTLVWLRTAAGWRAIHDHSS